MKLIQLLTLAFFSLIFSYSYAQNLQFNAAVFYEYGGGIANGDGSFDVVTTGTLSVGANQVLKITSAGGTIGGPSNLYPVSYVLINGRVISINNVGNETFLPTGSYTVGFTDVFLSYTGEVKGFISGVLYDVVP